MNLTIEKMIYGGDGLARNPGGKTVFLPLVLPGEEVSAEVVEEKSGYLRAAVRELLRKSEKRIEPACPYFARCGGCHYQHTGGQNQLEIKKAVLRETLLRTAKFEWKTEIIVHSAAPWGYRNRTRFKVRHAPEFALGYYRLASHELLAVEQCPISSPAINRALAHLWEMGRQRLVPPGVTEIEIFADHADSGLLLEIYGARPDAKDGLATFFNQLQQGIPGIQGMAFFPPERSGSPGAVSFGQTALTYQCGDAAFRVSAGSFFQVNRFLVAELAETVAACDSGGTAFDLYAGAGLFAWHLARRFNRVYAVESSPASMADLRVNVPENVKTVASTTEEFLAKSRRHPDLVVVDPPRAGLGGGTTKLLTGMAPPKIAYLSCDPATLARDLNALLKSGYRVEEIHLFDLFPQTFHIETLVRLQR